VEPRPRYNAGRVRILKWISLVIAGLVVLLLVAALVLVWFVDPNAFKPRIEAAVKEATGRDFALVGDIELGFFPWLALRTGAGHFGNAPGFGSEPMVRWKSAQLGAKLIPLLRGDLVASRVRLDGVEVRLVRLADGRANWEGIGADAPEDPDAKPKKPRIDGVELANSRISFVDETVPRHVIVDALNFTTDEIEEDLPFTGTEAAGVLHMDGFAAEGVPFKLDVPHARIAWDLSVIAVKEYELSVGGLSLEGMVSGGIVDEAKVSGTVETNSFDPRALLASMGIEPPGTTDPKALGAVRLETNWSFDSGAIGLDPLALTVDETHLTGNFRRAAGADPLGEFALRGDSIDLARYIPPSDPASEPFVLPTAMLKSLKLRGTLEFERATLDGTEMKGVTLRLVLDEPARSESKAAGAEK
jgi:AsmA protein